MGTKKQKAEGVKPSSAKTVRKTSQEERDLIFMCHVYQKAEEIKFVYRGYYHYMQNSDSTIHRSRKDDIETIKKIQVEMKSALKSMWSEADIRRAYHLSILNGWFIAISSELDAWKKQESFLAAYRHLKKILQVIIN